MVKGGMDNRLATPDEFCGGVVVTQFAFNPFDSSGIGVVETCPIAFRPIPTTATVPKRRQMTNEITADETGRAGDGDLHGHLLQNFSHQKGQKYHERGSSSRTAPGATGADCRPSAAAN
jgi:hypothetical protein